MVKKTPLRFRLDSIADIQNEIKRLYRHARNGGMQTQDMTRYTSVLHTLVNIMRDSDLESRIQALESVK